MKNTNPTVVDAIQQLKVVHALSKEQDKVKITFNDSLTYEK